MVAVEMMCRLHSATVHIVERAIIKRVHVVKEHVTKIDNGALLVPVHVVKEHVTKIDNGALLVPVEKRYLEDSIWRQCPRTGCSPVQQPYNRAMQLRPAKLLQSILCIRFSQV